VVFSKTLKRMRLILLRNLELFSGVWARSMLREAIDREKEITDDYRARLDRAEGLIAGYGLDGRVKSGIALPKVNITVWLALTF
jgi:hypothetical protein